MDKGSIKKGSDQVIDTSSRNIRGNNIKLTKTINYIRKNKIKIKRKEQEKEWLKREYKKR